MSENKAALSVFAKQLRLLRAEESQSSFAEQICVHPIQYSKYERGVNSPKIDVLMRICRVTGISADWLLGLTPIGSPKVHYDMNTNTHSIPAASKTPGSAPICKPCKYLKAIKKLQKAGLQLPGTK